MSIQNSQFLNLGSPTLLSGSAIYSENSNLDVKESLFKNNQAKDGGALDLQWSSSVVCTFNIEDNTFTNNSATNSGGAIRYNLFRPSFSNNIFTNNSAAYGPNIGSYAIKIRQKDNDGNTIKLENVGSGLEYEGVISLEIVDHDGQIINLDSISQIEIKGKEKIFLIFTKNLISLFFNRITKLSESISLRNIL